MNTLPVSARSRLRLRRKWMRLRTILGARVDPWRGTPADFPLVPVRDLADYRNRVEATSRERARWRSQEASLIYEGDWFETRGYCVSCERWVLFRTNWNHAAQVDGQRVPNWREQLICPGCGLNNRMRAVVDLTRRLTSDMANPRIYMPEQLSPLFARLKRAHPNIVGSEYLENAVPLGAEDERGTRNEDITRLTFGDGEFDLILNFEVMEHVPDFLKGFAECARILKPGGKMLFSAPFDLDQPRNQIRARFLPDGTIKHIFPPEYHDNPINPEGSLAFQIFGWELLDQLAQSGFTKVQTYLLRSRERGHLGPEQSIIVAEK